MGQVWSDRGLSCPISARSTSLFGDDAGISDVDSLTTLSTLRAPCWEQNDPRALIGTARVGRWRNVEEHRKPRNEARIARQWGEPSGSLMGKKRL